MRWRGTVVGYRLLHAFETNASTVSGRTMAPELVLHLPRKFPRRHTISDLLCAITSHPFSSNTKSRMRRKEASHHSSTSTLGLD